MTFDPEGNEKHTDADAGEIVEDRIDIHEEEQHNRAVEESAESAEAEADSD